MNSKIRTLQKTVKRLKRKLEKIRKKSPDFYNHIPKYNRLLLEYKSMLNHKTQIIRKQKSLYFDKINHILQNSNFTDKLSWRLIKKKKNTSSSIPPLTFKDKTVTDPTEKSEILHSVLVTLILLDLIKNINSFITKWILEHKNP